MMQHRYNAIYICCNIYMLQHICCINICCNVEHTLHLLHQVGCGASRDKNFLRLIFHVAFTGKGSYYGM